MSRYNHIPVLFSSCTTRFTVLVLNPAFSGSSFFQNFQPAFVGTAKLNTNIHAVTSFLIQYTPPLTLSILYISFFFLSSSFFLFCFIHNPMHNPIPAASITANTVPPIKNPLTVVSFGGS